jgi:predicted HicB family RNase H-like nuclease
MGYLHYKGYKGNVEYSERDGCLCGYVLGMKKSCITYEGSTIDELKADFEAGVDSYLDCRKTRNKH